MGFCKHCGQSDGCKPVGGRLNDIQYLSADDWAKVHWFLKYIQLPFIHRLVVEAEERAKVEGKWRGR